MIPSEDSLMSNMYIYHNILIWRTQHQKNNRADAETTTQAIKGGAPGTSAPTLTRSLTPPFMQACTMLQTLYKQMKKCVIYNLSFTDLHSVHRYLPLSSLIAVGTNDLLSF